LCCNFNRGKTKMRKIRSNGTKNYKVAEQEEDEIGSGN
jgi:hypothetical protein